MTRFIVFTLLMLAFLIGAVLLEGGSLGTYLWFTTLAIVLLVPFFSAFAVWGFREIGRGFRNALGKGPEAGPLEVSVQVWDFFEKTIYAAGVLGLPGVWLLLRHRGPDTADEGGGEEGRRRRVRDPAAQGRPQPAPVCYTGRQRKLPGRRRYGS
jgi:hypothetical protein